MTDACDGSLGIFNPGRRGKGLGRDALIGLLDFAFAILALHVVYLWVESFNEHAVELYRRIGFSERGVMRELACRNGKHCDVTVMDIPKREFQGKHGILPKKGAVTGE